MPLRFDQEKMPQKVWMNAPSSWLETNVLKRFLGKNAPTFYQEQMSQIIDREPTPPKVDQEQKPPHLDRDNQRT